MQLKAGKKYTDRRGRIYGPLVANHALFGECRENYTWSIDGRVSQCREYDIDLVAEYVEPAPVESPDDLVIQDRVPARAGIDQECWSNWRPGAWSTVSEGQVCYVRKMRHGEADHMGDTLSLRCRRKDLPPVPPKTRTVVLKEWICWDVAHPDVVTIAWCSTDLSEDSGSFVEYDNAQATGETRTVEIPVT
jgi:hypothetical protein